MKFSEFTDDMYQEMIDIIKSKLLKLGIDVDVFITPITKNNIEYIEVKTSTFNTTPTIYKSVIIGGSGSLSPVEYIDSAHDLCISLYYRFEYFDGGRNGVNIGTIQFRFFEKSKRVICLGLTI